MDMFVRRLLQYALNHRSFTLPDGVKVTIASIGTVSLRYRFLSRHFLSLTVDRPIVDIELFGEPGESRRSSATETRKSAGNNASKDDKSVSENSNRVSTDADAVNDTDAQSKSPKTTAKRSDSDPLVSDELRKYKERLKTSCVRLAHFLTSCVLCRLSCARVEVRAKVRERVFVDMCFYKPCDLNFAF